MSKPEYTLEQIARHISAELKPSASTNAVITGIGTLEHARPDQIAFLANPKYHRQLAVTKAAAVIIDAKYANKAPPHIALLLRENPYLGFAKAAALFDHTPKLAGVAASAKVAKTAKLGKNVVIGEGCVVEDHVTIGDGTVLKSNVTVCHHVHIGSNCIIHPGAVVGSDGFGNAWDYDAGGWVKVPQLGGVTIGDDVEIGANSTIDRGALEDTIIGNNVRIDNLVQIAHNVEIGDHTALAAQTGVAGSAKIGKNCILAGKTGVNGHVEICDGVTLTATTCISHTIHEPGIYSAGLPAKSNSDWRRNVARFNQLGKLLDRVDALEQLIKTRDKKHD